MKYILISLFLLASSQLFAQLEISGKVLDGTTGEGLIGATVLYGPGQGVVTDLDGNFVMEIPKEGLQITVSFVGYEGDTIVADAKNSTLIFKLKPKMLREVEVVADIAQSRETPVAFSTITPVMLEEELASQDLPMILNKTPGAYATQQGGGDGDARINIRGFNQRNVAVMIDGIPVNDMENGWVYWSNWFGLDMVTRTIQIQRGLGASKIAIPSIGGTMNIVTKGIDSKFNASFKQEVASDGYMRSSIGLSSGPLKNGWGVTFAGAYKRGNGYADLTHTEGWFYFLRVDKKFGKHLFSLSAMGAPQQHGQRSYKSSIAEYSTSYAQELGIDTGSYITGKPTDMGLRFNPNWGYLNRYDVVSGDTVYQGREKVNEKLNYYHKPQFSFRHFWNASDKLYMSNIAYLSIGKGGGTGVSGKINPITSGQEMGLINFQSLYNDNYSTNADPNLAGRGAFLYSSINSHFWYGVLNTTTYKVNKSFTLSGGVDLRSYTGQHYREVYDLLGMDYHVNEESQSELYDQTNESRIREEGDNIDFHNDGLVRWSGLFFQTEYREGNLTAFINITGSYSGYKRIDYFKKMDIVIGDEVFKEVVGYTPGFIFPTGWVDAPDTFMHEGQIYTANSPEARYAETKWKYIPGFTVKGGVNYNLSETSNVFTNLGFISKAPRFSNVYDYNNKLLIGIENEKIKAIELGYSYYNKRFTVNLNAYYTQWENKPADYPGSVTIDDEQYKVNINGMDALHMGVELEAAVRITDKLLLESVTSYGDWRWTSSDSARIYDQQQNLVDVVNFDAKGLYVGDAAQFQQRESIRWEFAKNAYFKAAVTFFSRNYSNFDPLDYQPGINAWAFDDDGNPRQAWQMPNYYLIDIHAGYRMYIKDYKIDIRGSLLNALDDMYISDASNNDSYVGQSWNSFDARSAAVFYGLGRRFNISVKISI
jgi:CarboxypepD_reg-like domain/TonB-dependent Receptor Plug Domain/TonB dependent receptor-like, beta-barrel